MAFDGYIMLYPKKIQKYVYLQLDGEKPEILLVAKLLDLFVDPFQSHVCCMYPPSKSSRGKSSKVPFFFGGDNQEHLVGGLEYDFFFHRLGISSSQLRNSIIFHRGRLNHQPDIIELNDPLQIHFPATFDWRIPFRPWTAVDPSSGAGISIGNGTDIYINPDKKIDMGMDQYLLIPFLGGWTSIYQLFWCSPGVQGFDTLPYMMIPSW